MVFIKVQIIIVVHAKFHVILVNTMLLFLFTLLLMSMLLLASFLCQYSCYFVNIYIVIFIHVEVVYHRLC